MTSSPPFGERIELESLDEGTIWLVSLAAPKANIIDTSMIEGLVGVFEAARAAPALRAVILRGSGKHFSFGASVEEHLPEKVGEMLPAFHRLFGVILDAAVPTLAAVSGQCLGGGLELVALCHRVFARADANLGQPEIVLGVVAPVASVLLAERMGRGAAEDLCLSGRGISGEEAARHGLVDALADDPTQAALEYAREFFLPRSASSLRFAVRAVRAGFAERFRRDLERTERLYLDQLMQTHDAAEGIRAFIDKREPQWRNA